jgi:hypothetical protein
MGPEAKNNCAGEDQQQITVLHCTAISFSNNLLFKKTLIFTKFPDVIFLDVPFETE